MKKSGFSILFILLMTLGYTNAQYSENALGLRFSGQDEDGIGAEISYQRALGNSKRGELNLGFRDSRNVDAIKLTGIYQWVWNIEGGLNWYAGPAVGVGIVSYDDDWPRGREPDDDYTRLLLSVGGDVGIEYIFEPIPLQLALDVRPGFYLLDFYDDFDVDVGLALRWQFRN